ncbi:MAG: hypothetical protein MPW14_21950 [Candidatus Manganitrophus sp.]|nr:hypothetical protein [Candidatus Manganitrophus sp.]WDT72766.1 MAG: hypothetical protein MPW17_07995 [Candidatus Manganitrophus sp.]WDT79758.1 MAG: hypothetical protein MPW14_21950 [Candidatus Manganitrophus sp.]
MDSKVAAPLKNERGMALISIMLMIVLMTSLLMMALNISSIEINLASTNRRTTQGLHAGEGGADLVIPVVKDTLVLNAIPTYPIASKVVVNPLNTAGGLSAPDFVREMTSGSSPTGGLSDNPKNNPNVTITALSDQTIQVDVDYEGPASLPGSELEEQNIGYHRKAAGTGCAAGTVYYINSLATGPMKTETGTSSAYFHCS